MKYLPLLFLIAGCTQADPYTRSFMWQPDGANSRNLALMVANPSDLLRGHGDGAMPGLRATTAARRLDLGQPVPLLDLSADTTPGAGKGAVAAPAGSLEGR